MMFPNSKHDDQVDSTNQALDWVKNGNDNEAMMEYLSTAFSGRAPRRDAVPSIRVRHVNGGSLQTITGRNPIRDPDGSFLLTEEEWVPSLIGAGFILVD
jgi:hypothetical protein